MELLVFRVVAEIHTGIEGGTCSKKVTVRVRKMHFISHREMTVSVDEMMLAPRVRSLKGNLKSELNLALSLKLPSLVLERKFHFAPPIGPIDLLALRI